MKKIILFLLISLFIANKSSAQNLSDNFASAKLFFDQKDFATAYKLFAEISNGDGLEKNLISTAKYYSAASLFNLNQIEGCIAEYEDFINKYKYSNFRTKALYELGTIYFEHERYVKSREKLLTLLREYPTGEYSGSSYYWIGKSYYKEKNLIDAEQYLKESITKKNNNFLDYSLYTLANLYEDKNDYKNAVNYYDELLAYHHNSSLAPLAQMRVGACYFKMNEYDKAILELSDPLIADLPTDLSDEAQYLLANSFFRLKEYENAQKSYKKLLSNYKDEKVIREVEYGLAWISFQMREYEEAYRLFGKLAKDSKDSISVNSMFWSGECLRYLDKTSEAMEVFNNFLKKYPGSKLVSAVNFNLGLLDFNSKKSESSEKFLILAAESNDLKTKAKAYSLLGEIRLQKKDYAKAREYFQNALSATSNSEDVYRDATLGLGISCFYLDDYNKSIASFSELYNKFQRFEPDKVSFYFAEAYFAAKNYSAALKQYHRVSDADANFSKLSLIGKAYAYFNLKDFANASIYFREFITKYKNDKNYLDAKLRLADSYYGLKDFTKAGVIYGEIFSGKNKRLDNDFAYYQYAQSLYKSGKLSNAIDEFATLQKKFPKSKYADDSQYLIGWIYFQQNNFRAAIKNYSDVFRLYPKSTVKPIAIYSIGDSYYNMGDYDSALTFYGKLINEYPRTKFILDAINGIQYCYIAKDQPDKAVEFIDRFISNNPKSEYVEEILMKRGEIYYTLGNYNKAEYSYLEFLNRYPSGKYTAEAYYWIGKSYSMLKKNDSAIEYFNMITTNYLTSKFGVDAVIESGELYKSSKNFDAALALYSRVIPKISDEKRIPEVMFAKAMILIETKDYSNAYSTLNETINYYDGSIFADKAKIELSLIEIARSKFDNAEKLLKELGQTRRDDIGAQAQYLYGVVLLDQGKIDDAMSALVRVRSIFSSYDFWYSKSLIALGDCYSKKNDKKNAREMYRAVIEKHSKDELGSEARTKLNNL